MSETTQPNTTASQLYQHLQSISQDMTANIPANLLPNSGQVPLVNVAQQPVAEPNIATPQNQPVQQNNVQPLPYNRATPPQESALMPGMYKPLPEELLLEWVAPSRPFKKPNRRFFTSVTVIGILIGLILFFANQILPVAVVIAVVFLTYVLFSIPPGDVRYRLTTYGLRIESQLYYWEELGRFWFTEQYKIDILHIEVARFPNTLHLLLGEIDRDTMQSLLSEVLLYERPPLTPVEKAAKWLQEKVPLDLES